MRRNQDILVVALLLTLMGGGAWLRTQFPMLRVLPTMPTLRMAWPWGWDSAGVVVMLVGLVILVGLVVALLRWHRPRRPRMTHTGQSAAMFLAASDRATQEANARVLRALSAQGLPVSAFTSGAPRQARTQARAILIFLDGQAGVPVSLATMTASLGLRGIALHWRLTHMCWHRMIVQTGHHYQITEAGRLQIHPIETPPNDKE